MNTCTGACSVGNFCFQDQVDFWGGPFLGCDELAVANTVVLGVRRREEQLRQCKRLGVDLIGVRFRQFCVTNEQFKSSTSRYHGT